MDGAGGERPRALLNAGMFMRDGLPMRSVDASARLLVYAYHAQQAVPYRPDRNFTAD
jgi:hypothetical protein